MIRYAFALIFFSLIIGTFTRASADTEIWGGGFYGIIERFDQNGSFLGSFQSVQAAMTMANVGSEVWISSGGTLIARYGFDGTLLGTYTNPSHHFSTLISVGDEVWAGEDNNIAIERFDTSGDFLGTFNSVQAGTVMADVGNEVWITSGGDQIARYGLDGTYIGLYQLNAPSQTQVFQQLELVGNEVWGGTYNGLIERYDLDGDYLGNFQSVQGSVVMDNTGNDVWISSGGDQFAAYAFDGTFLGTFPAPPLGDGYMTLITVPEPSCIGLCFLGATLFIRRRRIN